jgi:hypothetical protein
LTYNSPLCSWKTPPDQVPPLPKAYQDTNLKKVDSDLHRLTLLSSKGIDVELRNVGEPRSNQPLMLHQATRNVILPVI